MNLKSRLPALDIFRGLTVALMILVNSPGYSTAYGWLEHSDWDGCTLADLVFPFFIYILGISCVFSLQKDAESQANRTLIYRRIFKRALFLFGIGLFLNAFPHHFEYTNLRFLGVLQRIAICYWFSAMLFLTVKPLTQGFITVSLLLGYWLMLNYIPVPGVGLNEWTPEGNLANYIDHIFFASSHLYRNGFDPEGLLSTLPSIATALLGNLTGIWLLSHADKSKVANQLLIAGALIASLGYFLGLSFPINKSLWTSSYVLWTGGLALIIFAILCKLDAYPRWDKWAFPWKMFGCYALLAYVLHVIFLKIQVAIHITTSKEVLTLKEYITLHCFYYLPAKAASLAYAISYTGMWLLVLCLYNKGLLSTKPNRNI